VCGALRTLRVAQILLTCLGYLPGIIHAVWIIVSPSFCRFAEASCGYRACRDASLLPSSLLEIL
jgi:hypothetical protein